MKPQTILVDFDPERIFRLQERKSQIYNINVDNNGNSRLRDRIKTELRISPIITLDHNKLREVTVNNIMDAVRNYAATRSVLDEAKEMPVDLSLLDNTELRRVIDSMNRIDAQKGLSIPANKPAEGEENDIDPNVAGQLTSGESLQPANNNEPSSDKESDDDIAKKFASYYALILFFAFLTDDRVVSLEDIIKVIDASENNIRISKNLGLKKEILQIIQKNSKGYFLNTIDYKIQNTNDLNHDVKKEPLERVKTALTKFGRMSESEIVTPVNVADEMVQLLPDDVFSHGPVLDIASKQGEFTIALLNRFGPEVSDKIYSVCTSKLAYEFTRKVYSLLSLPIDHIFEAFNSYDLIKKDKKTKKFQIPEVLKNMNWSTIIGNPPYQETLEEGRSLAKQLFPSFIEVGITLSPKFFSLITPARWFTADAQDNSFPKLRNFVRTNNHFSTIITRNGKKLFPYTELSMVNYFLWGREYNGNVNFIENGSSSSNCLNRPLFEDGLDIIIPQNNIISIIKKIQQGKFTSLNTITTGRNAFGIVGKNFEDRSEADSFKDSVAVQCAYEQIRFIPRAQVKKGLDILDSYKVFTSKGNGGAGLLTDSKPAAIIGKSFLGTPGMACTDSLIPFGKFSTQKQAENLQKYMSTKFLRFCVGILKVSQNLYQNVYAFVPLQDFSKGSDINWDKSIAEIDAQLYAKYNLTDEEIAFIESKIKPM